MTATVPDVLSTRTQQMRYLVAELGVTRQQAHRLIKAYELDQRDADARDVSREQFGGWLTSNYWRCVSRRSVPRVSVGGWAVRSS